MPHNEASSEEKEKYKIGLFWDIYSQIAIIRDFYYKEFDVETDDIDYNLSTDIPLTLEDGENVLVYFYSSSKFNIEIMKKLENIIIVIDFDKNGMTGNVMRCIDELKKDEDYFKKLSLIIFGYAKKDWYMLPEDIINYANKSNIKYFKVNKVAGSNLKEGLIYIVKKKKKKRNENKKISNENQQDKIKKKIVVVSFINL